MEFWSHELEQLRGYLAQVEANPAAMHNLAIVEQTLEPGETPDWAINEAVTTQLHHVFLFHHPQDLQRDPSPGGIARRVAQVREALRSLHGQAPQLYASIVGKLDGGKKPIGTLMFWQTYFDLLANPSPYRVPPRPLNPKKMIAGWKTVYRLQEAKQYYAANELADSLALGRVMPLSRKQWQGYNQWRREGAAIKELANTVDDALFEHNVEVVQRTLPQLEGRVIDHPAVNEARGRVTLLPRERADRMASPHSRLLTRGSKNRSPYSTTAILGAIVGIFTIQLSARYIQMQDMAGYSWLALVFALVACGFLIAWMSAANKAHTHFAPLSAVYGLCTFVACRLATGSYWIALGLTLAIAILVLILYRFQLKNKHLDQWHDFVRRSLELTGQGNGGGIHTVTSIDGAAPWTVRLQPLPHAPAPFQYIQVGSQPEFSPEDFLTVTAAGEVASWVPASVGRKGMESAAESNQF